MPVRTGPITRDASTVAVGLAQIRVGNSAANIANAMPCLTSSHSIGALADTKLTSSVEFWKLESGFPAQEDLSIPIKETVSLECSFKEITPRTIALARGIDPTSGGSTVTAMGFTVFKSVAGTYDSAKIITCETTCPQDTFTVKFSSATAYTVEGYASGPLTGAGTVGSSSTFQLNAALQITIPASYFTGTWANDNDGVLPQYNIRTDRFDLALEAMGKVDKSYKAKREDRLKAAEQKEVSTESSQQP